MYFTALNYLIEYHAYLETILRNKPLKNIPKIINKATNNQDKLLYTIIDKPPIVEFVYKTKLIAL